MTPIVIDLEWNYPVRRNQSIGLNNEIIQIGAARIDLDCRILDSFVAIIRPVCYTHLHKDVADLTLLKNEDLQKGRPFAEVMTDFRVWCGDDPVFISWGAEDGRVLRENCRKFGVDTAWLPPAHDAQLMFDDMEMQEDRSWPLNYALYHFQEKPDGQHNALADVYSTILVLKHLDLAGGLADEYFRCDRPVQESLADSAGQR